MKRIPLVLVALTLLLPAAPASADGYDAGVLMGVAAVGKAFDPVDPCDPTGVALVAAGSPGIGLPVVNGPKVAVFAFAGMATTALHGTGPLTVCGTLYPVAGNVAGGVGAACGMSKGVGEGSYAFPGTVAHPGAGVLFLSDVLWKAQGLGHIIVTATVGPMPPAPPTGMIVGLLQTGGGAGCVTKVDGPPKAGGADAFTVVGEFAAVPGVVVDPNTMVPLGLGGKCPAFPPCLYGGPK